MLQLAQMELVTPKLIRLNFKDLKPFECVTDRYQFMGIRFSGAIALEPSNPIFSSASGSTVLMPMGNLMSLSAYFDQPSCCVGAFVCSTKIVVLTAFDKDGNFLGQISTLAHQSNTADNQPESSPQQLQINRRGIAKIEFSSCVPFTIDDFFFAVGH